MAIENSNKMGETSYGFKERFSRAPNCQTEAVGETRRAMALTFRRKEPWGELAYDPSSHHFLLNKKDKQDFVPYSDNPVVLNVDLTMNCNMDCLHCVTKDFIQAEDLVVSKELLDWINESPFLTIVITGGEPLLPEYEDRLITLLKEIRKKGLVVDTNGTVFPSPSVLKAILDSNALVRISWDAGRPQTEIRLRHVKPDIGPNWETNNRYFLKKIDTIARLRSAGVNVAVQSVIHKLNYDRIADLIPKLRELSINRWYIQRFIPSHKATTSTYKIEYPEYERTIEKLTRKCEETGIECISKKDRRHNCVILLVGKGTLYTQSELPGKKLKIGTIYDQEIRYFEYVSLADHAERYYGLTKRT